MPENNKSGNAIIVYTDGSSLGNPGPGGYGVVMISHAHKLRKEISEGFRETTNNRMELMAACVALETLNSLFKNSVDKWVHGTHEIYADQNDMQFSDALDLYQKTNIFIWLNTESL